MANPFRPGGIVEPEYFVGRSEEIARFGRYFRNTTEGNPHHLAVLGERGIGKTSLLRYLEWQIRKQKALVVRVELDPATDSVDYLVSQILEEFKRSGTAYSLADKGARGLRDFFQKYKVSVSFGVARVEPKEREVETKIEFRYRLEDIWKNVKGKIPAIVIMIDEAEQLENIRGSLQYLRNVFLRLSESHCGYMLVLSGKTGLFKQIKELHSPLARFFTPITLEPLTAEEVRDAVQKPFLAAKRDLDGRLIEKIIGDSEGHPYVVQTIGYVLFDNEKKRLSLSDYELLKPAIMKQLADQLFGGMLEETSPEEQKILMALAESRNPLEVKEIAGRIGKRSTQIGTQLNRLSAQNCVRKIKRGEYAIFHKLFGEFVLAAVKKG
ncbi:MAG: ATP-binding protein [Candidatus Micrarchaeota archaeon]